MVRRERLGAGRAGRLPLRGAAGCGPPRAVGGRACGVSAPEGGDLASASASMSYSTRAWVPCVNGIVGTGKVGRQRLCAIGPSAERGWLYGMRFSRRRMSRRSSPLVRGGPVECNDGIYPGRPGTARDPGSLTESVYYRTHGVSNARIPAQLFSV